MNAIRITKMTRSVQRVPDASGQMWKPPMWIASM